MQFLKLALAVVIAVAAMYFGWQIVEALVLAAVAFVFLSVVVWFVNKALGTSEYLVGDALRLLRKLKKLQQELSKVVKRAKRIEEIDRIWARINDLFAQLDEVDKALGARSVQLGRAIEELREKQAQDKDDLAQFEALVAKAEQEGKEPAEIVSSYTVLLHKAAERQVQSNESILVAYGELAETLSALHDAVREAVGWIEAGYASWEKEREVLKDLTLQDGAARRIINTMPPLEQIKDPFAGVRLAQLRDTNETVGRLRKIVAAFSSEEQEGRPNPIHVTAQEIAQVF